MCVTTLVLNHEKTGVVVCPTWRGMGGWVCRLESENASNTSHPPPLPGDVSPAFLKSLLGLKVWAIYFVVSPHQPAKRKQTDASYLSMRDLNESGRGECLGCTKITNTSLRLLSAGFPLSEEGRNPCRRDAVPWRRGGSRNRGF